MLKDEDYEIVESSELDYLRHEVEKLKRNPLGDTEASISLLETMNKLNTNIEKLTDIFSSANEEMVRTFNEQSYQEQMQRIRSENAKIAHGIVAVAELVKKLEKQQKKAIPTFESFLKNAKEEMLREHHEEKVFSKPSVAPTHPPEIAQSFDANRVVQDIGQDQNPFEDPTQGKFQPVLDQPLPHPGLPGVPGNEPLPGVTGEPTPDTSRTPLQPPAEPLKTDEPRQPEDKPIPADEIPPPPPKGL